MIKTWFHPEWSGDFRLESDGADKCVLTVVSPTPAEIERLGAFLKKARSKDWIDQHIGFVPNGTIKIPVNAPLLKAGRILLGKKPVGTLTAVVSEKGEVRAVTDGDADKVEKEASKPDAKAATTVSRPTLCCPLCHTVEDVRASEVLREFCTPRQLASWERDGVLHCYGNLSGRRYEVAHRHQADAVKRGKVIFDTEGGYVLHAHASNLPPAEEALTMKLVLEHAEDWVRNPSGCSHEDGPIYDNPFGMGAGDGVADAAFMSSFGRQMALLAKLFGDDN